MVQAEAHEWIPEMSVGVGRFDQQHRQILRLLGMLADHPEVEVHSEEVSDLLTKLTEYANTHLREEEKLMLEHGYPEFEQHRDLHNDYRRKVVRLCLEVMNREHGAVPEILAFLHKWWTTHIMEVDMRYKSYFRDREIA